MLLTNQMIWEVYRISKPTATRWADATFCHRAIGMFYPCTVGAPLAQNLEKGYLLNVWLQYPYEYPLIIGFIPIIPYVGWWYGCWTLPVAMVISWMPRNCWTMDIPWTGWELNGTPSPSARRKPTRTATAAKNSTGEPNSSRLSQLFEAVYN